MPAVLERRESTLGLDRSYQSLAGAGNGRVKFYATPKALVARLAEASKPQPDLKILNKPEEKKKK